MTFSESGLNQEIVQGISELGFERPTAIQEQSIPFLLENRRDLVALAQTGTGKTAAYGLPMLQNIEVAGNHIQGLILCPTRELCMQITNDLDLFSKYIKGLFVIPVYGGASIDKQIKSLARGGQIVVGTPGRMLDLIKRKKLKLDQLKYLVLDEADEMLNMGFKEDLNSILKSTPSQRQTMLFSATMPADIARLASTYMKDAHEISIGGKNTGAENVKHHFYVIKAAHRYLALKRIADYYPQIYGIVFCRTRKETKEIAEKLLQDGYNADALHGDLSQSQRDHVMQRFRSKHLQLLVATDVAARGLDVNELTHIINYNIPEELEAYIHRSGRTGRAGKHGISIAIIHSREHKKIQQLERKVGKSFEQKPVPTGKEICEKQLFNLIDKVEWVEVEESTIGDFIDVINKKLAWLPREELIKRFVSVEFNRFLSYYKDAIDISATVQAPKEKAKRGKVSWTRFHINLGKKNQMSPIDMISLINKHTGENSIEIGKIEIMNNFSFFEIDQDYETMILQSFKGVRRDGMPVKVEVANEKPMRQEKPKSYHKKSDKGFSKKKKHHKKKKKGPRF